MPRPELVARLERGASGRLTLVSAPAGSGKTTLLGEWLAEHPSSSRTPAGREIAWLSLDAADSDLDRFWTYVVAALQAVRPELGEAARAMLESGHAPAIDVVLAMLLNDIAASPEDLVLVLDDYHVIESAEVHDAMAFLVDRLPPQMHIVILSRADPALPLARLRARGELVELRAAELRFSAAEAATFLGEVMGLDLAPADVEALEGRTEGWIAGLQLAALSMQGRDDVAGFVEAFAGNDRYIVDYLVEEVLQRQPPRVREFLLRTSILERLSGALCDAVTGQSDGATMLEELDRANLFVVPLDGRRQWYRYHHLFGDVLRAHLGTEPGEDASALHGRASEWYAAAGHVPEAIEHALRGGHLELAATLIESIARDTVRAYRPLQLVGWLRQLPDAVIQQHPVLCGYYPFGLFPAGEFEEATRWLDIADGLVADPPATARQSEEFDSLPGIIAIARGYGAMAVGDVDGTIEQARRALQVLPEEEYTWRAGAALLLSLVPWQMGDLDAAAVERLEGTAGLERAGDAALAISSIYDAGKLAMWRGRLREGREEFERGLELWSATGDPRMPGAADLHIGLSAIAFERGDIDTAREHHEAAEEHARHALLPETLSRLAKSRARLHEADGEMDAAIADLEDAERLDVPATVPSHPIPAIRARVALRAGRVADVEAWREAQGVSADDPVVYAREYDHLTLARLLLHQAREQGTAANATAALGLLDRLLEAARGKRDGSVIEILLLQALASQALGDTEAALTPLAETLTRTEPEDYVCLFTSEGEPMRELLRAAVARGVSTAYASRLLGALGEAAPSAEAGASLPEPLTSREVEILRLIAAGMRNQEIADELVISVATVKRHIANAYGKLGVDHRTEAVARANELRLI